jgi:hypothetical protein
MKPMHCAIRYLLGQGQRWAGKHSWQRVPPRLQPPLLLVHGQDARIRQQISTCLAVPETELINPSSELGQAFLVLGSWTAKAADSLTPQH